MLKWFDSYARSLAEEKREYLQSIEEYTAWFYSRGTISQPVYKDADIDIRTYMLHKRNAGASRAEMQATLDALRSFYTWAADEGLIETNPFETHNFDRPILSLTDLRRHDSFNNDDPQARELAHLNALNQLTLKLNQVVDMQSALDQALEALTESMNLKSAWVFLHTDTGLHKYTRDRRPVHHYALAAHHGLPAGLKDNAGFHLRCTPNCHCQEIMDNGNLKRAVNIVECSRIQDTDGDTEGLRFHASVPLIAQSGAQGILNIATHEWQFLSATDLNLLTTAAMLIASTLDRIQLYEEARTQYLRLEREMTMAHEVQASLLPSVMPDMDGFSIDSVWHSAREVAGDFYDIFPIENGKWGIVIGDVSGKGAPAALYMAMTHTLVRSAARAYDRPSSVLDEVNRILTGRTSVQMFVSALYGVLDTESGEFVYSIAGHTPPLLKHSDGSVDRLTSGGIVMGIFDNINVDDHVFRFKPGDTLVLYTDGITEAENDEHYGYGISGLHAAIESAPNNSMRSLMEHILEDVLNFTGYATQADDITLVALSCDPDAS